MKNHLTERELIEYQFKLAPDTRMKEAAKHLQGCGECREHLGKLQRKFAALDLLSEEAKISEDLISHVVEQASRPARTGIIWFKKYAWLSSAAAVLLVGVLLVATQLGKDGTKKREVTKGPMPAEEMIRASKPEITLDESLDKDALRKRTFAMAPK
jgi:predicted anti-sigma-YlaC factor YlaD